MRERQRPGGGDVEGPTQGDFTDWNNPEDLEMGRPDPWDDEDAPEGYYDDEDDDGYIPGPDDPDYDLSEAAGYAGWEDRGRAPLIPQWMVVTISLILILSFVGALLVRIS
jgi:hypothetical protein